jgi:hypothetical protein
VARSSGISPAARANSNRELAEPTPPVRAHARLQSPFATISCKRCRSRLRQATNRFSLLPSSRSCRNSRSSFRRSPAYSSSRDKNTLLTDAVLAAHLYHCRFCFGSPQHPQNLLFRMSSPANINLLLVCSRQARRSRTLDFETEEFWSLDQAIQLPKESALEYLRYGGRCIAARYREFASQIEAILHSPQ